MEETEKSSRRPVLNLPQVLVVLGVIIALALGLNLSARARTGEEMSSEEAILATRLAAEHEQNEALVVTLTYVYSEDYVADYARSEAGMLLSGEKRVVPMPNPGPLTPTPEPPPIAVVQAPENPFAAWWMLFFDSPPPGRN
jgi:hypothetical protein